MRAYVVYISLSESFQKVQQRRCAVVSVTWWVSKLLSGRRSVTLSRVPAPPCPHSQRDRRGGGGAGGGKNALPWSARALRGLWAPRPQGHTRPSI